MRRKRLLKTLSLALAMGFASSSHAAEMFVTGQLKRDFYDNQTRAAVNDGTAGTPTTDYITQFFYDPADTDNYAQRISGYFVPSDDGNYAFFVAADDDTDVFLSTDENPANKQLIAQQGSYSSARNWVTPGDANSSETQKRSDQFTPDGGLTYPFAAGIPLQGGERYYIEAVHHQGGGGDHVGVTYIRYEDGDFVTDGDNTKLVGERIGVYIEAPATLTFTQNPASTTVVAGLPVLLSVAVNTDSPIAPTFQWRKNGTPIPGATSANYNFIAGSDDAGATFDVVASVTGLDATSSAATLTVESTGATEVPGFLKVERFNGPTFSDLENGRLGAPVSVRSISLLETGDQGNGYSQRVTGFFTPDVAGDYVFFVNSDDNSAFYISTDADPANKRLVAQETAWSNPRQWTTSGGGSTLSQKRSDQWSPDGGTTIPYADGIPLEAGVKYYIEALHNEGGGGDNLGATFMLEGEAEPVDSSIAPPGDASRFTGALISYLTPTPTTLTIATQPANITVDEGNPASFSVAINTDAELSPTYQWRRDGVNIGGATGSSYSFTALDTDNNAKFDVVVSIPNTALTATSAQATLTIESGVLAQGLKREFFPGQTRAAVENGTAGEPTVVDYLSTFDQTVKRADNYAQRISGFFIPPTSGDYTFFLAADDDTDLFLSTDENPANKVLIAQETSWSGVRSWISGGNTTQKRSDFFIPPGGTESLNPLGIALTGGERYYIEAVQHQGTGGDNIALTFINHNNPEHFEPVDGEATRMTGDTIAFLAPPAIVTITTQPQSTTSASGTTATFTVAATSDTQFPPISYQWKKNGADIAGATGASYTTDLLSTADNNAKYTVVVSAPGAASVTSSEATLTIPTDSELPTVVSAEAFEGSMSVAIYFSEALDATSAIALENYSIAGATVTSVIQHQPNMVELVLAEPVPASFTVAVSGVKDFAGNTMANANVTGSFSTLSQAVLGEEFVDPNQTGTALVFGDHVFINAGGSDIWGTADHGHIVYQEFSGAFDARVRVDSLSGPNEWTKAGLMVRESLAAGARNQYVAVTRNEGNGVNLYTHQWRDTVDTASGSLPDAERIRPVVYPSWVRLVRESATSNEIKSYISQDDGATWTPLGTHTTPGATIPANVFIGLAVTSHDNTGAAALGSALFTGFSVEPFTAVEDPELNIAATGASIEISWATGTLVASPTIDGEYQPVAGATSPYPVTTTGAAMFYQVQLSE